MSPTSQACPAEEKWGGKAANAYAEKVRQKRESREKGGEEEGGARTWCGVEKRVKIEGRGYRMQVKGQEGQCER